MHQAWRDWSGGEIIVRALLLQMEAQDSSSQAKATQVVGEFYRASGRVDEAAWYLEQARDLWESVGAERKGLRVALSHGFALALARRWKEGERELLQVLGAARRKGFRDIELWSLYFLGRAAATAGAVEKALDWFHQAEERARALGLDEARFAALYRAWECAGGEELERKLRRLLPRVQPTLEEAKAFRAAMLGEDRFREGRR